MQLTYVNTTNYDLIILINITKSASSAAYENNNIVKQCYVNILF